jgi:hypothetical protein
MSLNIYNIFWTKFVLKEGAIVPSSFKEQSSSPGLTTGTNQIKMKMESSPVGGDIEEPLVHFKRQYMVRLIQWHLTEELLVPSVLIEWLSNQLQEIG